MAKSNTNADKGKSASGTAGAKRIATSKAETSKTATKSTTAKSTKRGARARTSARDQRAGAEGAPASRAEDATAKKSPQRQGAARGTKTSTNQHGRQGAGPASSASPLRPIRQRQTRNQILATVAADSGVERAIAERVARSFATTCQRHLMRGGSGQVEIPYLGGVLRRATQGARKARTMMSPLVGRNVDIPARKAQPTARFKAHSSLRATMART